MLLIERLSGSEVGIIEVDDVVLITLAVSLLLLAVTLPIDKSDVLPE